MSLQYCEQVREEKESAEIWIGCMRVKANGCKYKESRRRLKEHFINRINDYEMMAKIIK